MIERSLQLYAVISWSRRAATPTGKRHLPHSSAKKKPHIA